jgi:hypothetical protein
MSENFKERDRFGENLDIDERIILKWTVEK